MKTVKSIYKLGQIVELKQEIEILKQKQLTEDDLIENLDIRISKLKKENSQKSKQISDLQLNLGALTAGFFDLENKLISEFGDKFKTSAFNDKFKTSATEASQDNISPSVPAPACQDVSHQTSRTRIVDCFDKESASADPRLIMKQAQRQVKSQGKGKLLFMKNSDKNIRGDRPQLSVTELDRKRFKTKYGDRTRIKVWGFYAEKNIWVIKRNSGNVEYYKHHNDFCSWTKIDFTELSDAPFHNPSNDPRGTNFKLFLENQVKRKFDGMKTAESFVKKTKGVFNPSSNRTIKNVMWPPAKQMKQNPIIQQLPDGPPIEQMKEIPIIQRLPDGSLQNMEYWVFDEATATVVIELPTRGIRLLEAKDLLQFGERDIRTLARHQIVVNDDIQEIAAKEFTGMVGEIINKKMWLGALGRSNVLVVYRS